MTIFKSKFDVLLLALLLFALFSCTKDAVKQVPILEASSVVEGLSVTIKGSAIDMDGKISEVIIEWGDEKADQLAAAEFAGFEVSHTYVEPENYFITISANDNTGDSTVQIIAIEVDYKETSFDNIKPNLFKYSDKEYLILTLNLHTYQESWQNEKFYMITDVIGKMDIDFIAFQECAQHKSASITEGIIREDNMALIISDGLQERYNVNYNFVWDWAHYGWNVWEEGIAILSKHPLVDTDNRYVSSGTSTGSITSRKVIYASYDINEGRVNIFSAHTHWRTSINDEEQNNQIKKIKGIAEEKETGIPGVETFVCGDFNGNPTSDFPWSEGYHTMRRGNEYSDTFLEIYPDANNMPAQSKYRTVGGDFPGRIDYIFSKDSSHFRVVESQIIFTNEVIGKVSDHFGVLTKVIYRE